jgi:hypothetical protein
MKEHEEDFREWYEKESGTKLTDKEVEECLDRVCRFFGLLEEWKRQTPNRTRTCNTFNDIRLITKNKTDETDDEKFEPWKQL